MEVASAVADDGLKATDPPVDATNGVDPMKNILFLSLIMVIIVVPTRLAGHSKAKGPQRTVFFYLTYCFVYYFLLRFVIGRVA